jgi:hypothetical protein
LGNRVSLLFDSVTLASTDFDFFAIILGGYTNTALLGEKKKRTWSDRHGLTRPFRIKIGNRGLTTALAIKAIESVPAPWSTSAGSSPSPTVVSHSPVVSERRQSSDNAKQRLSFRNIRRHTVSTTIAEVRRPEPTNKRPPSFAPLARVLNWISHGIRVRKSVDVGF